MLKTLKTLIRVQDNHLKNLQKKLDEARRHESNMQQRLDDFTRKLARETQLAMQDNFITQSSYSNYIPHAKDQQEKLQSLLRDAQGTSKLARANLMMAYREMKKLKNIQEKKKKEWQNELDFQEQKMIDDLVQLTYARKHPKKNGKGLN